MGTAEVQGELWGASARDWAEVQEPPWRPVFETLLREAGVGRGTKLLDVGCGAGGALVLARAKGAEVAGLDASEGLVAIARQRLPGARIEIGEMEALPFPDRSFDVVTGINAFPFAGDIVQALCEARRVVRVGGTVAMLAWGRREDCELVAGVMPAIFALLPRPPEKPPSSPSPPLGEPGAMEALMRAAGLDPDRSGEIASELVFPDVPTAIRAIVSAGAVVRAVRHAGEDAVTEAVARALQRFTRSDGSVALANRFRWATASRD